MLAERTVAGKRTAMRRLLTVLLLTGAAFGPAACREQPEGVINAIVIGQAQPQLQDPALGPVSPKDAVLLQNVAQGLVRFDATGNIVSGLAERWNVSDDGLSYIFRLAPANWPDGKKITAQQVSRLLKRQLAARSRNSLKDALGATEDIVAMTDRVIEIQLISPRPNFLALLAQPELAILRDNEGTGPFKVMPAAKDEAGLRLSRAIATVDEEVTQREEVQLAAAPVADAIRTFAAGKADLVLGGTYDDLPLAQRTKLPRNALRFDPASGLFGLIPVGNGGGLDDPEVRNLLSQAFDRSNYISVLGVPGLAPRATLVEPGLSDIAAPVAPAWFGTPFADRLANLRSESDRLFGAEKPTVRVMIPEGPGGDLLLRELSRDWGAIGLTVVRVASRREADFAVIDEVAPSTSAAWFVRRFRCGVVPVCDTEADGLMDAARATLIPAQRYALLGQAAGRIDDAVLFIPITAPVRWSLTSSRIQGFAGNRYARHTLTGLEQQPGRN